jgi:choline dehydrogenase-like flavoprotein
VFSARSLFLAAGTLSTTKIVLTSNDDVESRLPILDNPMSCLPLFRPSRIGAALETNASSLAQVNLILEDAKTGEVLQASIYGTTGPLHSDTLFRLPLNVSAGLAWTKYLAPAAAVVMLFYPGKRHPTNYIRLTPDRKLEINYARIRTAVAEKKLLKAFRGIGYYGAMALCQYPPMGSSLHYAATLPMKETPGRYETDRLGRLFGTKRIFVCDGSCFSALPAKNLTFTIMANAMRIARGAHATIQ